MLVTTTEKYFVDLNINILTNPEIYDVDVINQSIISILSTEFASRPWLLPYGSLLPNQLFETFSNSDGEALINSMVQSIQNYEDRVKVIEANVTLVFNESDQSLEITIPYIIINNKQLVTFNRIITF